VIFKYIINNINNLRLEYIHKKKYLRIGYYSRIKKCNFGKYNTIYDNVSLRQVSLGDFSYVSSRTIINNARIGKFCSIGPDCRIGLGKHPTRDFVSTHPIFFSDMKQTQITFADKRYFDEFEEIYIGNDVWIGANAILMDGVHLPDGVIVGAGSVVTRNVPAYTIIGGIPARIIRYRFAESEIDKILESCWWDWDIEWLKKNFHKFHDIKYFIDFLQKN